MDMTWTFILAYISILFAIAYFIQLVILTILIFLKKDVTQAFFYRRFIQTPSDGVRYMGFSLLMSIPILNIFGIFYLLVSFPFWLLTNLGNYFSKKIEQNHRI